ncbi:hypothetical protein ACFFIF_01275 [Vagococcus entomophilus]|uniref:Uncharacterized protein n=1 Tax=Vagococcus entomophilus TaxID=1160095 RepID=A0A430AKB3_9ENTE|nr:hypothetical protein [Vagococcus entomophilus]RSU08551.1 hypothetical protein CBF30_04785 [Vagococcus entomophilus]
MSKHKRTAEELEKLIKKVKNDFPLHHRKISEITIEPTLTPKEAIQVAKTYHKKTFTDPDKLNGTVNEDINQLLFDEAYTFKIDPNDRDNDDIRPAWRVTVDLPDNPFLMEEYTLIVSDKDKKVMGILSPNGHPVYEGNEFTDEDIEYVMSEDDHVE